MADDFPYVVHRIAVTDRWSIYLPLACKLRIEEDAMVVWRPGFTVWMTTWSNDGGQSAAERKAFYASTSSSEKYDEREQEANGRLYYSYRLAEASDDDRVAALYAFAFAAEGHLQMSIYFDHEKDADLAYGIVGSASDEPPTLADASVYSRLCFVTNRVMQEGEPVRYAYREESIDENDSGWRMFAGTESQKYVDDAANTKVYPLAFAVQVCPALAEHLLAPVGTQLEGDGDAFAVV